MTQIHDFEHGFNELASAQMQVEHAEELVAQARSELRVAETRLRNARDRFDAVRTRTIELVPALETGYAKANLTETVALVDGVPTVVPIEDA